MKIFGYEFKKEAKSEMPQAESNTYSSNVSYGQSYPIVSRNWDGEKTLGELGLVQRNIPDYLALRLRAYDAYTRTDLIRTVTGRFFKWIVGSGLKLQAEPNRKVLATEGIIMSDNVFQETAQNRFAVYANSKNCDYTGHKNLHALASDFFESAFLGGDALCIIRFKDYGPCAQFISGEFVKTPPLTDARVVEAQKNGGDIEHGIEYNSKGETVAYYVETLDKKTGLYEYERILAKGVKSGKVVAWLIFGQRLSPDHKRGVPVISQILEKAAKLDRYAEAAVGKAEQAAKITYAFVHDSYSTGENPLSEVVNNKRFKGVTTTEGATSSQVLADGLANRIIETTSNQAWNLPNGVKLESFSTDIETDFGVFYKAVFEALCAAVDVPPEVAIQAYNSNYSASRAAINSWGYVVDIARKSFADSFYAPFYSFWLEWEILSNKINAPGYLAASRDKNFMVTDSYAQNRFTGKNMPHIDPLKEIKAIREMLGVEDQTPLISREQAAESLNVGEWSENFLKNLEEEKIIPEDEPIEEETDDTVQG